MESPIRIGTRRSPLAQWQAEWVAQQLKQGGVSSRLVLIETKGDRMLDVGIPEIGSKGVFTEDIEQQLGTGQIDMAVHSAKDMPSMLPEGFELVAFTIREQAHDVLVSGQEHVNLMEPICVGTSSSRRVAQLKHYYPHITTQSVRGNLQTRIRKLDEGSMDALVLAYAGVCRMGMQHLIRATLSLDQFTPAVGQGSLAIEVSSNLDKDKKGIINGLLNHLPTWYCLRSERAFLKTLQGGCSIPAFANAVIKGKEINIQGGIISLDGQRLVRRSFSGSLKEAQDLGNKLAQEVLQAGGHEILSEIKKQLKQ